MLNSLDVRYTDDRINLDCQKRTIIAGKYFGDIRMRFEYAGHISEFTDHLHIDPETLDRLAKKNNWDVDFLYTDNGENYLVKLSIIRGDADKKYVEIFNMEKVHIDDNVWNRAQHK